MLQHMKERVLQAGLLWCLAAAVSCVSQPCDLSRPGSEICDDFCNYRCSFFNASAGENGGPKNITLYRMTPRNVTGIRNKDTGDAPGDVTFFLSKKNLTQMCARSPTTFGCFLDGDNVYGEFLVEISTQYGPYLECNPVNHGILWKPDWVDTRNFMCGQNCLLPNVSGCQSPFPEKQRNGTQDWGTHSVNCFCDGTGRHNKTVGREVTPFAQVQSFGPSWWPPQCFLSFQEAQTGPCLQGRAYSVVTGFSFDSTSTRACEACANEERCEGWVMRNDTAAELLSGNVSGSPGTCVGGLKHHSRHGSWGAAGQVGGYWYSTPLAGECAPGSALGAGGCSWRVVSARYKNASCIDRHVDKAVEEHGAACFATCAQPLNRTSDCYLDCYKNTLLGDAGYNISAMKDEDVYGPWAAAFSQDDERTGGCPLVRPDPCEGPQCMPGGAAAKPEVGEIVV